MAPDGKFKKVRLSTNPSPEDLRALELGDVVYLDGVIPAPLAAIGDADAKGGPEGSAWEAMRRLQERATLDFERAFSIVRDGWKELARSIELERLRVEQDVAVHYAANRLADGEEELTRFMREITDRVIERAIQLEAAI